MLSSLLVWRMDRGITMPADDAVYTRAIMIDLVSNVALERDGMPRFVGRSAFR